MPEFLYIFSQFRCTEKFSVFFKKKSSSKVTKNGFSFLVRICFYTIFYLFYSFDHDSTDLIEI